MCALANLQTTSQPCTSCAVVIETWHVVCRPLFASSLFGKITTQNQTCTPLLFHSTCVYLCVCPTFSHAFAPLFTHAATCVYYTNDIIERNIIELIIVHCALLQISLVCPAPTLRMSPTSCGAVSATPSLPYMGTVTIDGKFKVIICASRLVVKWT